MPRLNQLVSDFYDEQPCASRNVDGPCWIFRGYKGSCGYGQVKRNGKLFHVHRLTWAAKNGPIPDKMVIDHKCRVRACCNPDHLRLVDARTNTIENSSSPSAINARKTHCPKGHEYTEENIYWFKTQRKCKECRKNR